MKKAIIKEIRREDSKLNDSGSESNSKKKACPHQQREGGHQQCFQLPAWRQRPFKNAGGASGETNKPAVDVTVTRTASKPLVKQEVSEEDVMTK